VGTDNVMLNSPDIFHEMEFISKLLRLDEREILKMCTWNSARILKEDKIGLIEEGMRANLVVIRADTPNMSGVRNWMRGVVRRATRADIGAMRFYTKVNLLNLFYVPSSQDSKYLCCSGVSSSISISIDFNFNFATSSSIAAGTGYTSLSSCWFSMI